MKKILKFLIILIVLVGIFFIGIIGYATLSDYKPNEKIVLQENKTSQSLSDSLQYELMTWNIGYCGLSKQMDFFYDGGKNVRPTEKIVDENIIAVKKYLNQHKNLDFILLQEVDKNSKRSYHRNQFEAFSQNLNTFNVNFGKNYDVFYVPLPITNAMGKVKSGIATFSKYIPKSSVRYSFPGNYSWPKGLFMLDRCFVVNRYSLDNGKELILINTHNSAYDDGSLRERQMKYIEEFLLPEYEKGNYIIAGGDWNQCPPNFEPDFEGYIMDNEQRKDIGKQYFKDWKWVYSNKIPTNRRVAVPFDKSKSPTTVIDYFLISPNVEDIEIENIDLNFENSDHNPVKIKIKLKSEKSL